MPFGFWRSSTSLLVILLGAPIADSLLADGAVSHSKSLELLAKPYPKRATWFDRYNELREYRNRHDNTLVPKRYADNPALGNWVNKQRQQYRRYRAKEFPCSLDEDKVQLLNDIGFCWDATESSQKKRRQDNSWWLKFEALKAQGVTKGSLPSSLTSFLSEQREEFEKLEQGEPSKLDSKKVSALVALDPEWHKPFHERQWNLRFKELEEYRVKHGNCCVPISYKNKKLAHWVSNLRKRYKAKDYPSGKVAPLSQQRVDQLNELGFVWDRWEYEFDTKYDC